MSLRTLPILFFNLGGEMLYILDQRLKAQNVTLSKSQQVIQDIVSQMFDSKCVKELFRPQKVLNTKSLRVVFNRLAHASIMKLNATAMDKLYDLMVMAIKYQFLMCRRGEDVILVTLNHLDTIRKLLGESVHHTNLLDSSIKILTDYYSRLPASEFMLLRATLLLVFQDCHKRVSIFLKSGAQNSNGQFNIPVGGPVPNGFEIPGPIRYYNDQGSVKYETRFYQSIKYELPQPPGSWALRGDRVISFGTNMYATNRTTPSDSSTGEQDRRDEESRSEKNDNVEVAAELKLLEKLIVGIRIPTSNSSDTFKLSWFTDDDDDDAAAESTSKEATKSKLNFVQINPSKKGSDLLTNIAEDFHAKQFTNEDSVVEDDVLDLLDSLS